MKKEWGVREEKERNVKKNVVKRLVMIIEGETIGKYDVLINVWFDFYYTLCGE